MVWAILATGLSGVSVAIGTAWFLRQWMALRLAEKISLTQKDAPFLMAALKPLCRHLPPCVWPPIYRRWLTAQLRDAGLSEAIYPTDWMAYQGVLSAMAILLTWVVGMIAMIGVAYPVIWLYYRASRRRRQLIRRLPAMVDMLTLLMEAGLDFPQALDRIADAFGSHPLGIEISRMLMEMRIGRTRREALERFRDRLQLPAITRLVLLLLQADLLGSPLGAILREEARQMRFERFQLAERAGQAAAQKLLFPLVTCIMPVTFIVVFGPMIVMMMTGGFQSLLGGI